MDAGGKPYAEFQFRHLIRLPTQTWPHKKHSPNSSTKYWVEDLDGLCSQAGSEINQYEKNDCKGLIWTIELRYGLDWLVHHQ